MEGLVCIWKLCVLSYAQLFAIFGRVEEYDDEEHDVLHKSVASAASEPNCGSGSSNAPMHITVQFPRLNNQHNNWLFRQHSNGNTSGAAADALTPTMVSVICPINYLIWGIR